MLSSIGASVDDQSAKILGNIAETFVSLATGPLAPGEPGAVPRATIFCDPKAKENLDAAKRAKATLEVHTEALKAATEKYAGLNDKALKLALAIDERTKSEFSEAYDALINAQMAQAQTQEAFTTALKAISHTRRIKWPEASDIFSGGPITPDDAKINPWFGDVKPVNHTVYLQIERSGSFGRTPARLNLMPAQPGETRPAEVAAEPPARLPDSKIRGLRYRMPAQGRLIACSRSPCISDERDATLATFEGPVTQLGYVNVLPFRSRAFGSNSFNAEFAVDGSLKSVGYEQKTAPAESLSGAIASSATKIAGALDPTARLGRETAYLKALKERRDAYETLQLKAEDPFASETSALGAETALINARIANLQALIALEELRATQSE
ncbi:hypothetical protein [Sphingomonas cavernae]|nr:hypothetical protein [Sphingomonas cavernae]